MKYLIREANPKDAQQILNLITELAVFEKEPNAVEITVHNIIEDGFSKHPAFTCFVAESANDIAGIALVYNRYSTWKGKTLHLEDLIVSKKYRGEGLGSLLLNKVVEFGKNQGVKRISWEVLSWNEPAIKFYENKGANILRDWHVVHLDAQAINKYIENEGI
ncbi:MAG: GNAT family N-acetyltransferase [Oceanihabitans sp.]